jgi:hypothetical protein
VFVAVDQLWLDHPPSFLYQTVIFLAFSTGMIYVYLYKAEKPDFFVQLYLLMMSVKLLAYGGYVYFMITSDKAGAFLNVVFFMLQYFVLTGLEITLLYSKISSKKPD